MEFDEDNAVAFMREHVDDNLSAKYPDNDDLKLIIDLVYDYEESNGMLDLDFDDNDDEDDFLDVDDLVAYIGRMLKKDKQSTMTEDDARQFVNAFLDYEESILQSEL